MEDTVHVVAVERKHNATRKQSFVNLNKINCRVTFANRWAALVKIKPSENQNTSLITLCLVEKDIPYHNKLAPIRVLIRKQIFLKQKRKKIYIAMQEWNPPFTGKAHRLNAKSCFKNLSFSHLLFKYCYVLQQFKINCFFKKAITVSAQESALCFINQKNDCDAIFSGDFLQK